jgi:hypothetical protein
MRDDIESSENTLNIISDAEAEDLRAQILEAVHSHSHAFLPLENLLGLTEGFVRELIDEKDDWAFIIKVAVIVEATLGKVINAFLQNPLIEKHIRVLPMGGRTGKIQLARDLGIIGPKSMARLRAIAEIRNDFAHSLGVVQLSIDEYFARLSPAEASVLWEKFFASDKAQDPSQVVNPKRTDETDETDVQDGKLLIYSCAWLALSELAVAYRRISNDSNWRAALVVLGEAFLLRTKGDENSARGKIRMALDTLKKIVEVQACTQQTPIGKQGANLAPER